MCIKKQILSYSLNSSLNCRQKLSDCTCKKNDIITRCNCDRYAIKQIHASTSNFFEKLKYLHCQYVLIVLMLFIRKPQIKDVRLLIPEQHKFMASNSFITLKRPHFSSQFCTLANTKHNLIHVCPENCYHCNANKSVGSKTM